MTRVRYVTAIPVATALVLAGCSSNEEPDATAGGEAPAETDAGTDVDDGSDEPDEDPAVGTGDEGGTDGEAPSSSVTVDPGEDISSDVEIRVGEIISENDGVETSEGTELSVPSEVLFAVDEAQLLPDAEERLDDIVEVLDFYPDAPVDIVGHTDSDGDDDDNLDLSERRAQAVADYLGGAGADATRFTVEGRGETEPVEDNDTDAGKQANRRVEILVRGAAPPDTE